MGVRIAIVDRDKCTKKKCGYLCQKACPGVRMGDETVTVDAEGFPVISETLCSGCGICVRKCPVNAIKIINLPHEAGKLIFQYGVNAFRLYNLPLPKKGATVGLIGANGIGKSTALEILSGRLKPNLGNYGKKAEWDEIIEKFKGQELQNYFESLKKKGVRISYKPQMIDRLPEVFKETVRKFIKRNDKRGKFEEAIDAFELRECLDRKIENLSGGELQRMAICAAYLKDADVYYIDEPSSYLDIKQRLKVSSNLRELAKEKAVIVVEHDLAVLDYMSDYIHVFYGTSGAYGVVSKPKGVRNGINEYLAGYLKEENVRFRSTEIKFTAGSIEQKGGELLFPYDEMSKRYSGFSLKCTSGEVKKDEVIGVIGPNAIGKSTFVKLLAGVEKPDKGEVEQKLRIAYKPQYIKSDFKGTVDEMIAATDNLNRDVFEREVKEKLSISELMEKKVRNLSGGELQRVAISLCICQEADLYLLDEPSAFLDVEQRLIFADVLGRVMEGSGKSAFVVDHDIVLIDSISDRLIVFRGRSGVEGFANAPEGKREGMNRFLKDVDVTLRRDKDSLRPRVNKPGSVLDREQKQAGEYYYHK
ncbi:MAG: ribosome biogenesis/translation initiation ATPase RLI [Candidatus Micrarchaeota archaeon]|nr:ribosome biogenesis/translation initiation ATPase RLI [Candidatus Micrarchaeota archaeon]